VAQTSCLCISAGMAKLTGFTGKMLMPYQRGKIIIMTSNTMTSNVN